MVCIYRLLTVVLLALAPSLLAAGETAHTGETVDGEQLVRVARQTLALWLEPQAHEVTLEPVMATPALRLAGGEVTLRPRALPAGQPVASRMQVWVDIWIDGRFVRAVPVGFRVQALRDAWVATHDVARGQALDAGTLEQRRIDIAAQGVEPWHGALQGLRAGRPLLAGHVLTARHVEAPPAVARGERIVARSRVGDIVLEARAQALQQGGLGQRVLVRVANAQGPVLGQVVEPGVVEIKQ